MREISEVERQDVVATLSGANDSPAALWDRVEWSLERLLKDLERVHDLPMPSTAHKTRNLFRKVKPWAELFSR